MADAVRASLITPHRLTDNASDTVHGIMLAVLAYLVWALGDAAAKWAIPQAGVAGAMIWRGIFGSAAVIAVSIGQPRRGGLRRLVPRRWRLVVLRSVLSAFVSATWYLAWRSMSLADTYAVGFIAPLLMTVLAIPMLGERIRWRRAVSTIVGFGGVMIMLQPGGDLWTPAVLLLLAGTVVMAITRIMTRQLSTTETPECQALSLLVAHTLAGFALLPSLPIPATIQTGTWLALALLGISSGLAHCIYARGYALAPVSALAPYEYTMLPWGVMFGFLLFGDLPSVSTLAGATVVAAAGIYNVYRERVRKAEDQAARR